MAIDSKNLLVAIKAYSRANPLPLDASEVHDSLEAAQAYAASAKAYPGQTIKVLQNGVYETYVLNPGKEGESGLALGKINAGSAEPIDTKSYVQIVEELPTSGQEQGVIYIDPELKGQIWTGDAWKVIFEQIKINMGGLAPEYPDGIGTIQQAYDSLQNQDIWLDHKIDELRNTLYATEENEGSIDYKIAQALVDFDALKRKIVIALPTEGEANIIYMVANDQGDNNIYDEYMWLNGEWEILGNTSVDLTNYYTKSEVYTKSEIDNTFATLAALNNYALKSDIPTVPTKVSELQNDLGFLTEHQDLSDYATKSEIPDVSNFVESNELRNYVQVSAYNEKVDSIDAQIQSLNEQNGILNSLIGKSVSEDELAATLANYTPTLGLGQAVEAAGYATKTYVEAAIQNAQIGGGEGSNVDLTNYVQKEDLNAYAKKSDLGNYSGYNTVIDYVDDIVGAALVRVVEF